MCRNVKWTELYLKGFRVNNNEKGWPILRKDNTDMQARVWIVWKRGFGQSKEGNEGNVLEKVYKTNKSLYHMLEDLVVEDKEGIMRGSEGEKSICNGISYDTE